MNLQEAKKIYFRLVQDYNLFFISTKGPSYFGTMFGAKENYYRFGLIPDLAELLPEKDKKAVLAFTESIIEGIEEYRNKRLELQESMEKILSNKFLTSRQKETQAVKFHDEVVTSLNKLVKKNKKLYDRQSQEFSSVYDILKQVKEQLDNFVDDDIIPGSFDLYGNCYECLEEDYSLEFADMLYKPDIELAKRDYRYYQGKGEEQSYGRHNERVLEEIGHLRGWKLQEYWQNRGFESQIEWLAQNHEDMKEQEELKYIEGLKKDLAYEQMMKSEDGSGLFKRILKGITNATN